MPKKIAKTTFNTGPNDKVAVVDVYTPELLESLVDEVNDEQGDLAQRSVNKLKRALNPDLLKQALNPTTLGFSLAQILDGTSLKKTSAADNLRKLAGGLESNLTGVGKGILTDVLSTLGFTNNPRAIVDGLLGVPGSKPLESLILDGNPNLKIIKDGIATYHSVKDIDSAQGAVELLGALTGNGELAKSLNMENDFAVAGNILGKMSQYKIPGLIDSMFEKYPDPEDAKKMALKAAPDVTKSGNVYALEKVTTALGTQSLKETEPLAVRDILANLTLPEEQYAVDQAFADRTLAMLLKVDPHWYQVKRNNVWVSSLSAYETANSVAEECMALSPIHRVPMRIARSYSMENLLDIAKARFPLSAIVA